LVNGGRDSSLLGGSDIGNPRVWWNPWDGWGEIGLGEERPREGDDETREERRGQPRDEDQDPDRSQADIFGASDCNCAAPGRGPDQSISAPCNCAPLHSGPDSPCLPGTRDPYL
jgi:hypothetical protein